MANIKQTVDLTQGTLSNLIVEDGKLKLPNVNAPTFTRDSIAYKSDGSQVAANQPRLDVIDGVMGLMVEEGTTNLFPTNLALSFSSAWTSWTLNGTYTVSIKGGTGSLVLSGGASGTVNVGSSLTFTVSNATVTFTPSGGTPAYCQLEQKPYATSFINDTRAAETLTIPTAGVLNPQEGTIECWVYVNDVVRRNIAGNWPTVVLIRKGSSAANWIWFLHSDYAGYWALQIRKEDGTVTGAGNFSDSLTPDGWHYFAIRWNAQAGTADLFHNGVKRVSLTGVVFPTEYDRIEIGHRSGGSGDWLNSLIDDLRISSIARSDAEIAAAYQSGQSLPVDEWTTYLLRFDNTLKVGRGGYRLSKPIYLKSLGTCNGSNISWEANIPAGCDVKVYASVDGSTFQECENNAPIPSLSEGVSLVDKVLTVKEVLLTEDGVNRPELMVVRYNVDGTVTLRG